jgi:hypothetical protein
MVGNFSLELSTRAKDARPIVSAMGKDAADLRYAPISLGLAFRFAWRTLTRRFGLFTAILLTFVAAWVVLEVVVVKGQQFGILLWAVAHVAFLLFFAGLEAGLVSVCLDLHDGGAPTFASAFARLALAPKVLAGQIIYLLLVVVGLALLVVPGIYLAARFWLFSFRLVEGESNLVAAFRQSAALSKEALGQLSVLIIALDLLNLLGAAVLGLGLFLTIPLSVLMLSAVYRQLIGSTT